MNQPLRVPCAYQGGKQRVAQQLVDILLAEANPRTVFYDLCCGSGAISIELVNRGVSPSRIVMLDCSSWGAFWHKVGDGSFNLKAFEALLKSIPSNKCQIKKHMINLALQPINELEAEIYLILQACSFGGKQIWLEGNHWKNAFFRDYWVPNLTSKRRSPANPMQPSPTELLRRTTALVKEMRGVTCHRLDIMSILTRTLPANSLVYVDPPYHRTTQYAFKFDLDEFISEFRRKNLSPLFVSEGKPISTDAIQLKFGGAKGGISGVRPSKHQEWLNRF